MGWTNLQTSEWWRWRPKELRCWNPSELWVWSMKAVAFWTWKWELLNPWIWSSQNWEERVLVSHDGQNPNPSHTCGSWDFGWKVAGMVLMGMLGNTGSWGILQRPPRWAGHCGGRATNRASLGTDHRNWAWAATTVNGWERKSLFPSRSQEVPTMTKSKFSTPWKVGILTRFNLI